MANGTPDKIYPRLKDSLNAEAVQHIARSLKEIDPAFNHGGFTETALEGLDKLELKARVHHLIQALHQYLPTDFIQAAGILQQIKIQQHQQETETIRAFTAWPLIDYLAVYGLEHPEVALQALAQLTSLFSAEFAIRPFIHHHYELTYQHLQAWTDSPDYHIRRLVSEGTRPRLPWGAQLPRFIADPAPILPLLERLNNDSENYVRRSVANNLNDISKDHPDLVLQTCAAWQETPSVAKEWIVRHATRTLVKQGDPRIFALLGYTRTLNLQVELEIEKAVLAIGEEQSFAIKLLSRATTPQKLLVDYVVHFMKGNGQHSGKVFKWKSLELAAGEQLILRKKHAFKLLSTRRYYPGTHFIEIKINGESAAKAAFELNGSN
jgi:3-methyladenine DNA glycosylase AlkC